MNNVKLYIKKKSVKLHLIINLKMVEKIIIFYEKLYNKYFLWKFVKWVERYNGILDQIKAYF